MPPPWPEPSRLAGCDNLFKFLIDKHRRGSFPACSMKQETGIILGRLRTPEDQLGDGLKLHEGRAFVNLSDLGIAQVLFHRVVSGEPVTAVDLNRLGGHPLSHL